MTRIDDLDLMVLNTEFETLEPQQILSRLIAIYGDRLALSSSFGADSMALIHMATGLKSDLRVIFIDTGWHFPETLAFRDEMVARFHLNLKVYQPAIDHEAFIKQYGHLYETDPDRCCAINKVEPMQRAIADVDCWVSGVRRAQASTRTQTPNIERRPSGMTKAYPLARWSTKQVYDYMQANKLPHHPLWEQGYMSIGCAPCTAPVGADVDERSGRWAGKNKVECGLHTQL